MTQTIQQTSKPLKLAAGITAVVVAYSMIGILYFNARGEPTGDMVQVLVLSAFAYCIVSVLRHR